MNTTSFFKGPAVKAACIAILAGTATFVLARRGGLLRILRRKSDCKPKDKSCSAKSGIATVSSSPNDAAAVPSRDDLQPTKAADEAADATSSSGGPSSPSGELALAAVNDKSSSGPSDASTGGCASSASSGNTAAGSLSGTGLSAFRGDNAACSATTADTIATAFPNNAKEAQVETVERTEASCMSDEEVKAFIKQHGLTLCIPERELGKGAFGHVEMVIITLPDGTTVKAARKTLHACETKGAVAALRRILNQELAGLAAAAGCEHAVQCLGYRLPTDDDERAELLLSCAEGGSVENLLNALAKEHFDRIDNAPERRRTGKNKDKYEMLPYPGNTLMDEADLKGMLRAMALFIKHLNARGYMHFDLKPANLLYDIAPDGSKVFRVCDFNLAVKTDSNGRVARAQGGTRGFWAWETYCQLEGLEVKHPITRAADVASMGLVLADAAGLHCLGGGTQAYLEYLRDLPRRTPPALKELIEWMVAEDPAARPTPDQILAHRWLTG
ncbi:hypothetical protein CHLRE_12g525750v5 [Chlamydomonas reinhardtii]|uniref:holocytochrome-c synthase n=1 Tax=Chlamydomonas reinhardtii TaxID=3055 RepID=A0A2K3D4F8_CHLRE|nr:uncharacterized protein CHLRE_12g525750v5 [Chlamydomonas reinhardtii]PNW75401.1 hypothetical protein CHLRE_12g525750v5 [Chlamydomonas reinhardtii]